MTEDLMLRIVRGEQELKQLIPTADGECPDCGHTPLENRVVAWAKDPDGENVEEAFCPECGWSTG